jgi:hypothetical protein
MFSHRSSGSVWSATDGCGYPARLSGSGSGVVDARDAGDAGDARGAGDARDSTVVLVVGGWSQSVCWFQVSGWARLLVLLVGGCWYSASSSSCVGSVKMFSHRSSGSVWSATDGCGYPARLSGSGSGVVDAGDAGDSTVVLVVGGWFRCVCWFQVVGWARWLVVFVSRGDGVGGSVVGGWFQVFGWVWWLVLFVGGGGGVCGWVVGGWFWFVCWFQGSGWARWSVSLVGGEDGVGGSAASLTSHQCGSFGGGCELPT